MMPDRVQTPEERTARVLAHPTAERMAEAYAPNYLDLEQLEERGEPPPRNWAIEDWLGMGYVTLLAAKGGKGKSLLAMQLAVSMALGKVFIGQIKMPRTSLLWMGEDDADELWRRLYAIGQHYQIGIGSLRGKTYFESMVARDCTLQASVPGFGIVQTPLLKSLREQIGDLKAEVVVLDNAARMMAGNHNDNYEVTRFISGLQWAAEPTGAAVLLISHVARVQGSEYAGSAAWENACRGRLWLTDQPPDKKPDEQDEQAESPLDKPRYLAKRKFNYSSEDLRILRYEKIHLAGAYTLANPIAPIPGGIVQGISNERCRSVVLGAMVQFKAREMPVTESRNSQEYLPKMILEHGLGEGFTRHDLARAVRALRLEGVLVSTVIGQYANRTPKKGLTLKAGA